MNRRLERVNVASLRVALMASAILGSLPVVIVYGLSLNYFISGMTTGATK